MIDSRQIVSYTSSLAGYDGVYDSSDKDLDDADEDTPILIREVDCDGDEDNLGSCDLEEFDSDEHDCSDLAAVVCGEFMLFVMS